MSWLKENTQTLLLMLIGLAWVVQMVGQWLCDRFAESARRRGRRSGPKLTAKNLALPLVGVAIAAHSTDTQPTAGGTSEASDLFAKCGADARALLADEFEAFAAQRFDTVKAKEDAINQKITDVIASTFQPFRVQVAKAIKENRLVDYARKIKAGEADEQ